MPREDISVISEKLGHNNFAGVSVDGVPTAAKIYFGFGGGSVIMFTENAVFSLAFIHESPNTSR